MDVAGRLATVRTRIEEACARAGRAPGDVTLVAVSKTIDATRVRAAIEAGVTDLGENRAQEFGEKRAAIGSVVRWHFVGHLQTNKVRHVVGRAALIHSVDRYGVGEAIARRASTLGIEQDVLIEVNIGGEPTKHGVEPAALSHLAEQLSGLEGMRVCGLMTVPPFPERPEDARPHYEELRALGQRLQQDFPHASLLSMGMSRDLEIAIEEGATHVRVGESIFGPR